MTWLDDRRIGTKIGLIVAAAFVGMCLVFLGALNMLNGEVLDGRKATCYPTCLDDFPKVNLQTAAVVEDGKLITSRGPGTAMDFALVLVEQLAGKTKRQEVEAALVR